MINTNYWTQFDHEEMLMMHDSMSDEIDLDEDFDIDEDEDFDDEEGCDGDRQHVLSMDSLGMSWRDFF